MNLRAALIAMMCMVGAAHANVDDCPAPDAGKDLPVGTELPPLPGSKCEAVDYSWSLTVPDAPEGASTIVTETGETVEVPRPAPKIGVEEPEDMEPEQPVGGIQTNYNDREMVRVGEMDALQGRPVNMNNASNLGYMQGYTRGQQRKLMPGGR